MKNKYWTIRYKTYAGGEAWAHCISMSALDVIEWLKKEHGVGAEQINYMSGEEADLV